MELPNIMHPVAKLSTALAAALMLSGACPVKSAGRLASKWKLATNGLAIWFSASSHRMSQHTSYLDMPGFPGQSLPTV